MPIQSRALPFAVASCIFALLTSTAYAAPAAAPAAEAQLTKEEKAAAKQDGKTDEKLAEPSAALEIPTPSTESSIHRSGIIQTPAAYKKLNADLTYYSNLGTPEKVKEALWLGANPNARSSDGWPAISYAASRNAKESMPIVVLLVDAGADMNIRDPKGETPLMNAITNNNLPLVQFLVERGADFRAVNTKGRTVLAFAEYFGNRDIINFIKETIRIEEEKIREGKSRRRFYRMLDDFIFYNCANQYIAYNQQTDFYKKDEEEKARQLGEQAVAKILNARVELEHNFGLPNGHTESIAKNTQVMILNELEALISNRNRRKLGIGETADIDKRCKAILNVWRSNFEGYETTASRAEFAEPAMTQPTPPPPAPEVPELQAPAPAILPDHLKSAPIPAENPLPAKR